MLNVAASAPIRPVVTHHGAAAPPVATVVTVAAGINTDIVGTASDTKPLSCIKPLAN